MERIIWQQGYRSALMDVFYGAPLIGAASNPKNLHPDFVAGAIAAMPRCEELAELRDTDPLEYMRFYGTGTPIDWGVADASSSVEAHAAWDRMIAKKIADDARQMYEEQRADEMREEMLERRWHANDEDVDYEALAVEMGNDPDVRGM